MDTRQKTIVDEFSQFKNWEDRYQRIIQIGKSLPDFSDSDKKEDFKVRGCQAQVWLIPSYDKAKNILSFRADSDALIVKGLIAILLKVYSERTPQEILAASPEFVAHLGFDTNLSPSRANGLMAMIKQIKYYAIAFSQM